LAHRCPPSSRSWQPYERAVRARPAEAVVHGQPDAVVRASVARERGRIVGASDLRRQQLLGASTDARDDVDDSRTGAWFTCRTCWTCWTCWTFACGEHERQREHWRESEHRACLLFFMWVGKMAAPCGRIVGSAS